LRGEERRVLRERYAEPVLEGFHDWMERQRGQLLPKSPEGKALNYAFSNWEALRRYAQDGDLEIDNNAAGSRRIRSTNCTNCCLPTGRRPRLDPPRPPRRNILCGGINMGSQDAYESLLG